MLMRNFNRPESEESNRPCLSHPPKSYASMTVSPLASTIFSTLYLARDRSTPCATSFLRKIGSCEVPAPFTCPNWSTVRTCTVSSPAFKCPDFVSRRRTSLQQPKPKRKQLPHELPIIHLRQVRRGPRSAICRHGNVDSHALRLVRVQRAMHRAP